MEETKENMTKRIVAIVGGEDYSLEHVVAPAGLDLEATKRERDDWYHNVWCPAYEARQAIKSIPERAATPIPKCLHFAEWLCANKGCRMTTWNEVEEFHEC